VAQEVRKRASKIIVKKTEENLDERIILGPNEPIFLRSTEVFNSEGMFVTDDLTQLTLGLDRDSGLVAQYFDERNPAVMKGLETLIKAAKAKGKYVGICGQGPSDHPDLAKWLMDQGIDSVSLNPDSVIPAYMYLGKK